MRWLERKPKRQAGIRAALAQTIAKLRKDIEDLQAKGGFPHDYSLGFTNGLIFCQNRIEGINNKFYDRKTAIGELPRPVVFEHEQKAEQEAADEYEMYMDNVLERARKVVSCDQISCHGDYRDDLREALGNLDKFLVAQEMPPAGDSAPGEKEEAL